MKKIVVIGPESTGKSSLCEELAQHYNAVWCPEFAREYLLTNGKDYGFDDLLTIAKGQIGLEEKFTKTVKNVANSRLTTHDSRSATHDPRFLFIDTDMYVIKVWSEFVFGKCHSWVIDQVVERKYDLYLLCNVDLPWVKDELREYPDLETREKLYHIYKDIMINQSVPWIDISGGYDERLAKAIDGIEKIM
jgi:NadR type nicotinamide-nucleotide adenylyltransferase